jgi:hypothetical protein
MKAIRAEKNFGVIQFHCTENIAYFWFPKYHISAQAAKGTSYTIFFQICTKRKKAEINKTNIIADEKPSLGRWEYNLNS